MIVGGSTVTRVRDVDAAVRFWVEVLGTKLVALEAGRALVDAGGLLVRVEAGAPSPVRLALRARDTARELATVLDHRGVRVRDDAGALVAEGPEGLELELVDGAAGLALSGVAHGAGERVGAGEALRLRARDDAADGTCDAPVLVCVGPRSSAHGTRGKGGQPRRAPARTRVSRTSDRPSRGARRGRGRHAR